MGVLTDIVARKSERIAELKVAARPVGVAKKYAGSVIERLRREPGEPLRLIAEIKRRSPSAGELSSALSPADRAEIYESCGVAAISVLTDQDFFGGSFEHLADVAARVDVPLLCKDFVLDPVQIEAAAVTGAAMVLLIVRLLDARALSALLDAAKARDLEPFVEVTNESELRIALDAGARIVGVNARDLDSLAMDRERAARVLAAIPGDRIAVHLSGLHAPADVRAISPRADAALLGEALMRLHDPGPLLRELVESAGGPWRAR